MTNCTDCGQLFERAKGAVYGHLTVCCRCNGEQPKGAKPWGWKREDEAVAPTVESKVVVPIGRRKVATHGT